MLQLHREHDILHHRQQGEQMKGLINDRRPVQTVSVPVHLTHILPLHGKRPLCGHIKTRKEGKKSALAAAGFTCDRIHPPPLEGTAHLRERLRLLVLRLIDVSHIYRLNDFFHVFLHSTVCTVLLFPQQFSLTPKEARGAPPADFCKSLKGPSPP